MANRNIWGEANFPEQLLSAILQGTSAIQQYRLEEERKRRAKQEEERKLAQATLYNILREKEYIPKEQAEEMKERWGITVPIELQKPPKEEIPSWLQSLAIKEGIPFGKEGEQSLANIIAEKIRQEEEEKRKEKQRLEEEKRRKEQKLEKEKIRKELESKEEKALEKEETKKRRQKEIEIATNYAISVYDDIKGELTGKNIEQIVGTLYSLVKNRNKVDWNKVEEYIKQGKGMSPDVKYLWEQYSGLDKVPSMTPFLLESLTKPKQGEVKGQESVTKTTKPAQSTTKKPATEPEISEKFKKDFMRYWDAAGKEKTPKKKKEKKD